MPAPPPVPASRPYPTLAALFAATACASAEGTRPDGSVLHVLVDPTPPQPALCLISVTNAAGAPTALPLLPSTRRNEEPVVYRLDELSTRAAQLGFTTWGSPEAGHE